jgi:hypothetical protein
MFWQGKNPHFGRSLLAEDDAAPSRRLEVLMVMVCSVLLVAMLAFLAGLFSAPLRELLGRIANGWN